MKKDLKSRKNHEKNRLKRLLKAAEVADWKLRMLEPIIENTAWMYAKLEDSMEEMQDAKITCEYDNGGGQRGTRQNPAFQGYEQLWKSYTIGMSQIMEAAGAKKDQKSEKLKPKSVIKLVQSKQRQA